MVSNHVLNGDLVTAYLYVSENIKTASGWRLILHACYQVLHFMRITTAKRAFRMDTPLIRRVPAHRRVPQSKREKMQTIQDKGSACALPVCSTPPPKKTGYQSRFLFVMLMVAIFSSTVPSLHAQASGSAALAKIEPHLAAVIAHGGNSYALIVLGEQADLSGADNLTTKQEKVQYVYSKLRDSDADPSSRWKCKAGIVCK